MIENMDRVMKLLTSPDLARSAPFRALKFSMVLMVALAALSQVLTFSDPDLGWHLRSGDWILNEGKVMTEEVFTYTLEGNTWVNHEWLYDTGLAALERADLWPIAQALAFLFGIGTILAWIWRSRDPFSLLALALAGLAVADMVFVRAQVVSIVLLAVVVEILRRQPTDRIFPTLPSLGVLTILFVIWANVHAAFPAGLGYVGIWIAVRLGERLRAGALARSEIIGACATLLLLALATLANPYGVALWAAMFEMIATPANAYISEWASPLRSWQITDALFFGLAIGGMACAFRRKEFTWIAPAIFALGYLMHMRFLPLFLLALAPLLVDEGARIYAKLASIAMQDRKGMILAGRVCGAFMIASGALVFFLPERLLLADRSPDPYPAAREALTLSEMVGGRIYHDSGFGSALIHIGGDRVAFSGGHVPHHLTARGFSPFLYAIRAHMDPGLPIDQIFDRYDIRVALVFAGRGEGEGYDRAHGPIASVREIFHPDTPPSAINARLSASGWCAVYEDDLAVVYVKPGTLLCLEQSR